MSTLKATSNGAHVFFRTTESLTSDDVDSSADIYRRTGPTLLRVSTGPAGGNGAHDSDLGGISADGSIVVFNTSEPLVAEDTDAERDLYRWESGTTTLLSIGPNGENGSCGSGACNDFAGMSRDGRHVFFLSGGHLVTGDDETGPCAWGDPEEGPYYQYPCGDIFESFDGVVRLVSTGPSDVRAPMDYELGGISDDGTAAAFDSHDPLLPEDTDAVGDVYRRDGDTLSLVSTGPELPAEVALFEFISNDGSRVIFRSGPDLWERSGGQTTVRTPGGTSPDHPGFAGATGDAEHVFFVTYSALVPQDTDSCPESYTGGCQDIYEHSGTGTRLVSNGVSMGNVHTGGFSGTTRNGNKAYFSSLDPLDADDTDSASDVYEYDIASGSTKLISTGPTDSGEPPSGPFNGAHGFKGASPDGSRVFFQSTRQLVEQDRNPYGDIYERYGNTTSVLTVTANWSNGIISNVTDFVVSDDASRVFLITDVRLTAPDLDYYDDVYLIYRGDLTGYPRPIGATPFRVPLVQSEQQCTAPNRTHGPPLAFPSCNPPVPRSTNLNAGVGDGSPYFAKSSGHVRLDVMIGAPGGPDDSDVGMRVLLTNVWWQGGTRVDYAGGLQARMSLRDTNKDGAIPNTIVDRTLAVDVPCTTTADDTVGSTCSVWTSADAVSPGVVPEGSRTVWGLGQVDVLDGGADGDVHTDAASNQVFAVQGVFVP